MNRPRIVVLLAILCLTFGLRLASHWLLPPPPQVDSKAYHGYALSILRGEGYRLDGSPRAYFPPGYPAFLCLVYLVAGHGNHLSVSIAQALLAVLTCLLVYAIAAVFDSNTGIIAAALLGFYPSHIYYSGMVLSEVLFTLLLMTSLWVIFPTARRLTTKRLIAAGAAAGAAALVREGALVLPLVILVWTVTARKGFRLGVTRAAFLTAGMAAVICPWTLRNAIVFGHLIPISTNGGVNFWIGNNPQATGSYFSPWREGRPLKDFPGDEWERSLEGYRLGLRFIAQDPATFLRLTGKKLAIFFDCDRRGVGPPPFEPPTPLSRATRARLVILTEAYYWPAFLLGLCGMFLAWRGSDGAKFLVLTCAFWTLIHMITFASPRFHFPIIPIIFIFAATAIQRLSKKRRHALPRFTPACVGQYRISRDKMRAKLIGGVGATHASPLISPGTDTGSARTAGGGRAHLRRGAPLRAPESQRAAIGITTVTRSLILSNEDQ